MAFEDLPSDFLKEVISYLDYPSLANLKQTNRFTSVLVGAIPRKMRLDFVIAKMDSQGLLENGMLVYRACTKCLKLKTRWKFSDAQAKTRQDKYNRMCLECAKKLGYRHWKLQTFSIDNVSCSLCPTCNEFVGVKRLAKPPGYKGPGLFKILEHKPCHKKDATPLLPWEHVRHPD